MHLQALDVIMIFDRSINPANWKRVVCICPNEGLFYRINSYDDYPIGVFLPKDPNHTAFLRWDSYIECGKYPLELDDYTISKALEANKGQVLGRVNSIHAPEIYAAVQLQKTISRDIKALIKSALGC
jgi:hypothetical protein